MSSCIISSSHLLTKAFKLPKDILYLSFEESVVGGTVSTAYVDVVGGALKYIKVGIIREEH